MNASALFVAIVLIVVSSPSVDAQQPCNATFPCPFGQVCTTTPPQCPLGACLPNQGPIYECVLASNNAQQPCNATLPCPIGLVCAPIIPPCPYGGCPANEGPIYECLSNSGNPGIVTCPSGYSCQYASACSYAVCPSYLCLSTP
uniref:CC domain-containing protein n=1 Tax=Steinernema glaseri TaxID=37863 RepID=A0A1I7YKH8_9BILA